MRFSDKSGAIVLFIIASLSCTCKNQDDTPIEISGLPVLTTSEVISITGSSAISGGLISSEGDGAVTARGVCFSTNMMPTFSDSKTADGAGTGSFISNLSGLEEGTTYFVRAYATNVKGTSYGNQVTFTTTSISTKKNQIIADHTIVDRFDDIPQEYIDSVKKMWVTIPGESHYEAYRKGCTLLEALYPAYQVNVTKSGDPEAYTDQYLRISNATWGDIDNSTGWIYNYGEEDWWTSVEAIARTKASIFYCNTNNLAIAAMGFAWCSDMSYGSISSSEVDPVYGCHWWGASKGSPSGNLCWGLDDGDKEITGNVVSISTYLNATQQYIDYCKSNKMPTRIFFTTGTVDNTNDHYLGERGYQSYLKDEYIRNYVRSDTSRILFDYADILTHDADGSITTSVWNGNSFPSITSINVGDSTIGHIGSEGAMRLGKALWWMLARMAGWDGENK